MRRMGGPFLDSSTRHSLHGSFLDESHTLDGNAGGFTPLSLSGLQGWWRGDASTITEVSGAVSQWDDKSGNARHQLQSTAARRPTFVANVVNGRGVVRFDGVDDHTITDTADKADWTFLHNGSGHTVFAVAYSNANVIGDLLNTGTNEATTTGATVYRLDFGGNTNKLVLRVADSSGTFLIDHNTSNEFFPEATWVAIGWTYDEGASGDDSAAYIDGTAETAETTGTTPDSGEPTTGLRIGARVDSGDEAWDGDIAEVFVYNRVLTAAEIAKVETYLAGRYGLTFS